MNACCRTWLLSPTVRLKASHKHRTLPSRLSPNTSSCFRKREREARDSPRVTLGEPPLRVRLLQKKGWRRYSTHQTLNYYNYLDSRLGVGFDTLCLVYVYFPMHFAADLSNRSSSSSSCWAQIWQTCQVVPCYWFRLYLYLLFRHLIVN